MKEVKPRWLCIKCGHPHGFLHSKPTYMEPITMGGYGSLSWTCGICGYVVETLTADAIEAAEKRQWDDDAATETK